MAIVDPLKYSYSKHQKNLTQKFKPMKRIIITLICFLTVAGIQAQTKTTYYKSSKFEKVVRKHRANYKVVRFAKKDTVVFKSYKIQGNQLLTVLKTLNGRPTGIWYKYNESGLLIYRGDFRPLVYSNAPIRDSLGLKRGDPRLKFYKKAEFPGGIHALMQFLRTHVHYPIMAKNMHAAGVVYIRFIVEKNGTAIPNSITQGVNPFLDLAAWNVIREMPKWVPATFKGKPAICMFKLPVRFSLNTLVKNQPLSPGFISHFISFMKSPASSRQP